MAANGLAVSKAGIKAGFQAVRPDAPERALLLAEVAAFTHQTDAGDQTGIAVNERVQIGQQRTANTSLSEAAYWRLGPRQSAAHNAPAVFW